MTKTHFLKLISLFGLFLLCIFAYSVVQATTVMPPRMNEARILVPDQSSQTLHKAFPDALAQTLVRMTGNPEAAQIPAIKNSLARARQWVQSYNFQTDVSDNGSQQLYLQVLFNHHALMRLLRSEGLSIWDDRPTVMVWLHVQQGQLSYFLAGNDHRGISVDLKNNAYRRGLPYMMPLMDYQDQSLFNLANPQAFNVDSLNALIKRYGSQAVLAGNIIFAPDKTWQGSWHLLLNGQQQDWNETSNDLNSMLEKTIDKLVDIITKRSSGPQPAQAAVVEPKMVQLVVEGISNVDDYAQLTKYLQGLSAVLGVDVKDMRNSVVVLNVNTNGGMQKLADALRDSPYLVRVSGVSEQNIAADLYYRWSAPHLDNTVRDNNDSLNTVKNKPMAEQTAPSPAINAANQPSNDDNDDAESTAALNDSINNDPTPDQND